MDTGFTLFGYTILKNSTEKEVRKLFQNYETALTVQRQKMCDEITEWGDLLIQSIHEYANQQKHRVAQEYKNQLHHLNNTHHRFLEEIRKYEQSQNTEQINQLLDRCKTLEFELAALEYNGQSIPFIKAARKERRMTNSEEFYITEAKNESFNETSKANAATKTTDNIDTNSEASLQFSIQATKQSNREQSTIIKRTNSNDQSLVSDNDVSNECLTCFMVFPVNMTPHDRMAHVNGHFQNN